MTTSFLVYIFTLCLTSVMLQFTTLLLLKCNLDHGNLDFFEICDGTMIVAMKLAKWQHLLGVIFNWKFVTQWVLLIDFCWIMGTCIPNWICEGAAMKDKIILIGLVCYQPRRITQKCRKGLIDLIVGLLKCILTEYHQKYSNILITSLRYLILGKCSLHEMSKIKIFWSLQLIYIFVCHTGEKNFT